MHKEAEPAARAAVAAQKQSKFWQMHDALFAITKLSNITIEGAAQGIGLDMERFKQDMNSPITKQIVAKDMQDAQMVEVTGTPTLFINGRRVENRSPEGMQEMINQELKKSASAQ